MSSQIILAKQVRERLKKSVCSYRVARAGLLKAAQHDPSILEFSTNRSRWASGSIYSRETIQISRVFIVESDELYYVINLLTLFKRNQVARRSIENFEITLSLPSAEKMLYAWSNRICWDCYESE